jgi:hypothetical protein
MKEEKLLNNKLANILWEYRHCKNPEDIIADRIECIKSLLKGKQSFPETMETIELAKGEMFMGFLGVEKIGRKTFYEVTNEIYKIWKENLGKQVKILAEVLK